MTIFGHRPRILPSSKLNYFVTSRRAKNPIQTPDPPKANVKFALTKSGHLTAER
jgi:hypothetical protein